MARYTKDGWMTPNQFAKAKGMMISPSTVLRAVQAGKIKAIQTPGGHYRIPTSELDNVAVNPHWNKQPTKKALAKARKRLAEMFQTAK